MDFIFAHNIKSSRKLTFVLCIFCSYIPVKMASKIVNEDDESSLIHVSLQPTQEAGIYFVSEPDRKDSKSATIRKNMESELHTEIAKENFVRQFKGDVGKTFNINDVSSISLKLVPLFLKF